MALAGPDDLPAEPTVFEMDSTSNVAYYNGPGADKVRHRLDIYVPKGHKDFPVIFMVHGGAWTIGDKNQFGIYKLLGKALTRHGIGMVSTNYRLSPAVQHPEHIRDVARAFAWTHKNISTYGGRPSELFVSGHSAGGHLAALLATDDTYLRREGLSLKTVRGAMPISGVYSIPRDPIFNLAFGTDLTLRKKASPISHARPDAPPFLILCAEHELPACEMPSAEAFCKALCGKQCLAEAFEVSRRNHVTILLNAINDSDPVLRAMVGFVVSQVALDRVAGDGAEGIDYLRESIARYTVNSVNGRSR
jgi:acetyl esterase/lipase